MKYIKMAFNYFSMKKFLQLIIVAAVPAVAFTLISPISSISDFLINYDKMDLTNFNTIFSSVSEFRFNKIGQILPLIFVVIIFLTEIFGIVERDMRVADFTLRGFFRRFNNNVFAVSLTVIILMSSILIMGLLSTAFFLLWAVLLGTTAAHIFSVITSLIVFALLVIIWVNFFLLVPNMIITGQSVFSCMRDSIRQTQGIVSRLIAAILLPLIPAFLLIYLERIFALNIKFVINVIIIDLLIVYYVVLMLVVHYDVTGLSREDLKPSSRYFR
ncbi:MAG: hypothetical protein ACOX3U_02930 [Christensenellales bacterium]|jgi:hypothetical protein